MHINLKAIDCYWIHTIMALNYENIKLQFYSLNDSYVRSLSLKTFIISYDASPRNVFLFR